MSKQISSSDICDRIIRTEQVAHITFYLVRKIPDYIEEASDYLDGDIADYLEYEIYTKGEGKPLQRLDDTSSFYDLEYANSELDNATRKLKSIFERKCRGIPTAKQLHFLFRHKIPIPLTLTWGEASDLIDEKLRQIALEKKQRKVQE